MHHGALAYLLGINALRASEAAAVRIEDYAETLRGHRVLHLVGKGVKPATMPLTVPVIRVLEACRGQRTEGASGAASGVGKSDRSPRRLSDGRSGSRKQPASLVTSVHTRCGTQRSPMPSTPEYRCATPRSSPGTPTHAPPSTTTAPAATSTATACTTSPPTSPAYNPIDGNCVDTAQIDAATALAGRGEERPPARASGALGDARGPAVRYDDRDPPHRQPIALHYAFSS